MTKDIDKLIDDVKSNLAYYLDIDVYLPVKEELIGIDNSLGIRKELFKNYVETELEKLKVVLKEQMTTKSYEEVVDIDQTIKKL